MENTNAQSETSVGCVTHRSHLRHAGAGRHPSRHVVTDTNGRVMSTMHRDEGDSCIRAPRVGAFATEPWTVRRLASPTRVIDPPALRRNKETRRADGISRQPVFFCRVKQFAFDADMPLLQFVNARRRRLTPNLMEPLCIAPTCQSSDASFAWLVEVRASRRRAI